MKQDNYSVVRHCGDVRAICSVYMWPPTVLDHGQKLRQWDYVPDDESRSADRNVVWFNKTGRMETDLGVTSVL